ncbi:hypothetical protein SDC9_210968 [bioreactor metagenome]|uniref:Uncharacterized protein n=1 Tax=bioreactor metagenome TaxID=1076179 RepID=A0A645JVF0_9ZZZZ
MSGAAVYFLGNSNILWILHGQIDNFRTKFFNNLISSLRQHLLVMTPVLPLTHCDTYQRTGSFYANLAQDISANLLINRMNGQYWISSHMNLRLGYLQSFKLIAGTFVPYRDQIHHIANITHGTSRQ